ncbi:MAG: Gfo/Idh/MocA family oxidoreductase [Clostridia bacterium]|nr:Gfo/Idh/MocA family oxidoreductase [Clostridia bacterium]
MKPVKIAVIGVGHAHAQTNYTAIAAQTDRFELVGYCTCRGEEAAFEKKAYTYKNGHRMTLEEIYSTPGLEAVAIEAEEMNLTEYALLAAERGLHIFLDKPGSADTADFERLLSMMKAKNLTLTMGYMYRHNPAVTRAIERVKSGALGEVYAVEAQMNGWNDAAQRQWLANFPGGQLFFLGCHLIDLVLKIQGLPDEIIPLSTRTGFDGAGGEDYGMAAFRYGRGVSIVKSCAAEMGGFMRRQLVIACEKGTIELQPIEQYVTPVGGCDHVTHYRETTDKAWTARAEEEILGPYNRYKGMSAAFADAIRSGAVSDYEYEARLHRVLMAACGVETDWRGEIRL